LKEIAVLIFCCGFHTY